VLTIAGCADMRLPGRPTAPEQPAPREAFEQLFAKNCAGCHGDQGILGAAPPLNDSTFLAIVPDQTLRSVIRAGRAGTLMPAFAKEKGGTLTAEEVELLAGGLKQYWRTSKTSDGIPAYHATRPGEVEAGAKVFARACAGCHGEQGQGTNEAGAIRDPAFLGLVSDQLLRRLIITGRPDLGMPDYAESKGREKGFRPLSDREVTDLSALLATWWRSAQSK
jgi:mono/diheme cytochrome c family protein